MSPSPKATKKEVVTAFRTKAILAAARRVLERHGWETATMEEIAATAGVAKGTIYLYFRGKEELIQALMSEIGENLVQDLEASLSQSGSARFRMQRVVEVMLDYLERERIIFPIYAQDTRQEQPPKKGLWRPIRELEDKFLSMVTRLFAEGIEAGEFIAADPRLLTFLLRGLVRSVGYYQMAGGGKQAIKEALPVLLTLLSSGLIRKENPLAEVSSP